MRAQQPPRRSALLQYSTAGLEFILTFGILLGLGMWLDYRLGSTPALTLAGGAAGFAGGLYRLVRQARNLQRRMKDEHGRDA